MEEDAEREVRAVTMRLLPTEFQIETEEARAKVRAWYEEIKTELESNYAGQYCVVDVDGPDSRCINPEQDVAELAFTLRFPYCKRKFTFRIGDPL